MNIADFLLPGALAPAFGYPVAPSDHLTGTALTGSANAPVPEMLDDKASDLGGGLHQNIKRTYARMSQAARVAILRRTIAGRDAVSEPRNRNVAGPAQPA